MIVQIKACRPLYLLIRRNSLVTLNTRNTLASQGPTLIMDRVAASNIPIIMSMKEDITTKKSKRFQPDLKYDLPKAISFIKASKANTVVKT